MDFFDPVPTGALPQFVCASLTEWQPTQPYDLITCVHGLHYVGDKLGVLTRAVFWLTDTGTFVADLNLAGIRLPDGRPAGRRLVAALRQAGFTYDPRRRKVRCTGRRETILPYAYLGADDQAGPNYTGQPSVNSAYAER